MEFRLKPDVEGQTGINEQLDNVVEDLNGSPVGCEDLCCRLESRVVFASM